MKGLRVLVTGATDGIGRALALALAGHGAELLLHGRNPDRLASLLRETGGQGFLADFARLAEVSRLARDVGPVDVLVANAGIFPETRILTEDGHELAFQVNHLAHLRLVLELKAHLRPGGRVIQVASTSHEKVKAVDLENLDWHAGFTGYQAYALSKLGQVAAALELAPGLAAAGVTINALHPGSILTKLQVTGWGGDGNPDPAPAVERILRLATDPGRPTGRWYVDGAEREPNPLLRDEAFRAAFWARSLALATGSPRP